MEPAPLTDEQRAEAFREFQADHLRRQTKAIETIKTYVGIWFWVTVVGLVVLLVGMASASSRF